MTVNISYACNAVEERNIKSIYMGASHYVE